MTKKLPYSTDLLIYFTYILTFYFFYLLSYLLTYLVLVAPSVDTRQNTCLSYTTELNTN